MRRIIHNVGEVILDNGVFFSQGVFETILYLEGPLFFNEHIDRLKKSMELIGLEPLEEELLRDFLCIHKIKNKAVKILVTPQNIIITERDIPYKDEDYIEGSSLTLSSVRRNSTSILSYIKSTSYIENILEKSKANKRGFKDALFLNEKGYIAETSCANIFIVKNDKIYTPRIENGLLNGVIRTWVINNFEVKEVDLTLEELNSADEVFITNSLMGIMSVSYFENIKYSCDKTKAIMNKYKLFKK